MKVITGSATYSDEQRPDKNQPMVLWIDDESEQVDALVRLLLFDGFRIDCVKNGATGLANARNRRYDAIILDLRLPDMHGLVVLQRLRSEHILTPVLILTGYHGYGESADVALMAGAMDFRRKPIFDDELGAALRAMLSTDNGRAAEFLRRDEPHQNRAECRLLRGVVGALDDMVSANGTLTQSDASEMKLGTLLRSALTSVGLSIRSFLACAEAMRYAVKSGQHESRAIMAAHMRSVIERVANQPMRGLHPTVQAAIAALDGGITDHVRPSEEHLAKELGLSGPHLGRLILAETGLTFRGLRRALAIRIAVRAVAEGHEHISQIAYQLGYEHHSQFDREFHELLGLSPREFRGLLK